MRLAMFGMLAALPVAAIETLLVVAGATVPLWVLVVPPLGAAVAAWFWAARRRAAVRERARRRARAALRRSASV